MSERKTPGLVIRFDGPPSHESGRFIEVEIDGAGARVGEWKQESPPHDDEWLLVLGPAYAIAPDLLASLERYGQHESLCDHTTWVPDGQGGGSLAGCNCGLDATIAKAKPKVGAT